MHRVRARLLQAYFTSAASDMYAMPSVTLVLLCDTLSRYLPDLVALPPISLRRRIFAGLIQVLPNVATALDDAQLLLELVPFASLADALQLSAKEASRRLHAMHKHLQREAQSVPSSPQLLGSITTQMLVDVTTEYFPYHSRAARSLLSFKGTGEHSGCSITQLLSMTPRKEWPTILSAAGIEAGECLDRIVQVAAAAAK